MGEARKKAFRVDFDKRLRLEFHGMTAARHTRYVTFQLGEVAVLLPDPAMVRLGLAAAG